MRGCEEDLGDPDKYSTWAVSTIKNLTKEILTSFRISSDTYPATDIAFVRLQIAIAPYGC